MGSQFFFIYDITVVAIIICSIYIGVKKGFVALLAGLVATIMALIIALPVSAVVSDVIYNSIIEQKLKDSIDDNFSEVFDDNIIKEIRKVDTSKILVNSKQLSDLNLSTDSLNKINLKLDSVDMARTGIDKANLKALGFKSDMDYSKIKVGSVIISPEKLESNEIGDIIFSYVIAFKIRNTVGFGTILTSTEKISDVVPEIFGTKADGIKNGNIDIISDLVLSIITSEKDISDTVLDNMVKPYVLVPIRMIIFLIVFGILSLILKLFAGKLTVINDLPVIGTANSALGAIVGAVQGFIGVIIISLLVGAVIVISENAIIFINDNTIDKTYIFKLFYRLDIMKFINQ